MISSSQRPLPVNTQHSQQRDIDAPDGTRTQNLSRRAAADLRLRPRGHWDRLVSLLLGFYWPHFSKRWKRFLRVAYAHHILKRRLSLQLQVLLVKWKTLHPESVEKLGEHGRDVATPRLERWTRSESYLSESIVLWSFQLGREIGRILQTVLGDVWTTFRIEYGRAMAATSYVAVRWLGDIC